MGKLVGNKRVGRKVVKVRRKVMKSGLIVFVLLGGRARGES